MLRAERSAATLRFARNTGGQICITLQSETMGEEGFELVKESSGDSEVFKTSGAECGANAAGWHIPVAQEDTDLKKLIAAWGSLPAPMRAAICSIVQASCSHRI